MKFMKRFILFGLVLLAIMSCNPTPYYEGTTVIVDYEIQSIRVDDDAEYHIIGGIKIW